MLLLKLCPDVKSLLIPDMKNFLTELRRRNKTLFYFGLINLGCAIICLILIPLTDTVVLGINSWIKPLKFYLSTVIFSWSMGWYTHYLRMPKVSTVYAWIVVVVLAFENIYISIQAGKGELSHFNGTSAFHSKMFTLMGIAIGILTVWTFIMGIVFLIKKLSHLPWSYRWGIRVGIFTFVVFALEGGLMAANLSHTVGAADGGEGLPLLNWSTQFGDLRIAHFLGMHALQVFPLAGFYVFRKPIAQIIFMVIYISGCSFVMYQALKGLPLIGL